MGILQTKSNQSSLYKAIEQVERAFSITLGEEQKERLYAYFSLLNQWNKSINLTGIKDPKLLVYKHLGDSLLFDKIIPKDVVSLLDIGTGAGIPGLLLKILRPELKVVLAEYVKKKCSFLRYAISILGLSDIVVEEKKIGPDNPPIKIDECCDGYEVIVSLAAGSLKWLLEISSPFLSSSGEIIALKGPSVYKELPSAKQTALSMGLNMELDELTLPILKHKRVAVIFRKAT